MRLTLDFYNIISPGIDNFIEKFFSFSAKNLCYINKKDSLKYECFSGIKAFVNVYLSYDYKGSSLLKVSRDDR